VSIRLGDIGLGERTYAVYADFTTAGGLREGAVVELAGVGIGRVAGIELVNYQARIELKIEDRVRLPADAVAAIKSKGLIGEKYVRLEAGQAAELIPPGGHIERTEPPVEVQEFIGDFLFGNVERQAPKEESEPWELDLE